MKERKIPQSCQAYVIQKLLDAEAKIQAITEENEELKRNLKESDKALSKRNDYLATLIYLLHSDKLKSELVMIHNDEDFKITIDYYEKGIANPGDYAGLVDVLKKLRDIFNGYEKI